MTDIADVIIIGAGEHGASLAFHLIQRGAKATFRPTRAETLAFAGAVAQHSRIRLRRE